MFGSRTRRLSDKKMKEVTLNKNCQISLVSFLGMLIIQPLLLTLAHFGIMPKALIVVAYILTFPLLLISIFFGIKQLVKTKFILFWVVPALLYFLIFFATVCYDVANAMKYAPPKRKIGVALNDTSNSQVQVIAVYFNSPADKAGVKNGDIIKKLGDEVIDKKTTKDVIKLISTSKDDPLLIEVNRNGEKKILKIKKTAKKYSGNSVPPL